jgi:alkaline phosphatase D
MLGGHGEFADKANAAGGERHVGLAFDVRSDLDDPKSTCAVEFLAPSISSNGKGEQTLPNAGAIMSKNPHMRFLGNRRGYTRQTVTPRQWQADFRVVARISTPSAPVLTRKSFVVEAGRPGLLDA